MLAKALQGATAAADKLYIEDVMSTYLYTGNNSTQTITNGIDLAGKGGMVWTKERIGPNSHLLYDTARGTGKYISTDSTAAEITNATTLTSFNSTGFSLGVNASYNGNGTTYASWTFRKAAKFFDVVTYTGNGTNRTIAHNLDSVPGCIIVKCTSISGSDWQVYHRSLTNAQYLSLNLTSATTTSNALWNNTAPTSTVFSLGTDLGVNANGRTYVAYLFAHDAGGFGLTGTDNVISCGSYAGTASGTAAYVDLGWEPQFVITKKVNAVSDWITHDTMRGLSYTGYQDLAPNLSRAEETKAYTTVRPSPTGFFVDWGNNGSNSGVGTTYIYIAIRRGPMKTPTVGTTVFSLGSRAGTSAVADVSAGFPQDSWLVKNKLGNGASVDWSFNFFDRLRTSNGRRLSTAFTDAEDQNVNFITSYSQDGITLPSTGYTATNGSGYNYIDYFFRRAPGFFDEVICTQTGSAQNVTHNLGVAPELLILKDRTSAVSWQVGTEFTSTTWNNLVLNSSSAGSVGAYNNYINAQPTSTVFRLGQNLGSVNDSFVAYLFATCPGVSKVGSYTGTGTTLSVNCGFTNGSRLVLIKRTDSTGDWYVWDTARGIISGNDPYLWLNSTAAEVTNTDYIDPLSSGFQISSTAPAAINANGGSFIFFAVA